MPRRLRAKGAGRRSGSSWLLRHCSSPQRDSLVYWLFTFERTSLCPPIESQKPCVASRSEAHRRQPARAQAASAGRMTMQLPYSNSAIETGTYTTIQVSMSQSDLVSLGFPINATIHDRRIAAELTLGDDGLPRTISLPLPLEVMKEKK